MVRITHSTVECWSSILYAKGHVKNIMMVSVHLVMMISFLASVRSFIPFRIYFCLFTKAEESSLSEKNRVHFAEDKKISILIIDNLKSYRQLYFIENNSKNAERFDRTWRILLICHEFIVVFSVSGWSYRVDHVREAFSFHFISVYVQ